MSASSSIGIDRSGSRRPGGGDDRRRDDAGSEIRLDQALEVIGPHCQPVVDPDLADGGLTEPEHVRSAVDREMGLRRTIEGQGRDAPDAVEPDGRVRPGRERA